MNHAFDPINPNDVVEVRLFREVDGSTLTITTTPEDLESTLQEFRRTGWKLEGEERET